MSKRIIADIHTLPDNLKNEVALSKLMLLLAVGIALVGVVMALSGDSEKKRVQYFVDREGVAQQGTRLRSVGEADIIKAYPISTAVQNTDTSPAYPIQEEE